MGVASSDKAGAGDTDRGQVMDDETLFGWLHLSDIHFGHGDAGHGWNQKLVLTRPDAGRRRHAGARSWWTRCWSPGTSPSAAADKPPDEYDRATAWLDDVGARRRRRAGAHLPRARQPRREPQRGREGPNVGRLVRGPAARRRAASERVDRRGGRRPGRPRAPRAAHGAATSISPPSSARGRAPRPCPPPRRGSSGRRRSARAAASRVRLVGLNTALLCSKDGRRGQPAARRGAARRGPRPPAAPDELVVVLSHHPLRGGWLADERAPTSGSGTTRTCTSPATSTRPTRRTRGKGGGGRFVRVVAGAAHGEANAEAWIPAGHGYNFGAIVREPGGACALRVRPRRWSDPNKAFRQDVDHVEEGKPYAEHVLRLALASAHAPEPAASGVVMFHAAPATAPAGATAPLAGPALAPAGPVRIFVSFAPDDEHAVLELDKALSMLRRSGEIELGASRRGAGVTLESADVVLVVLTNTYLHSDDCFERRAALGRATPRRGRGRRVGAAPGGGRPRAAEERDGVVRGHPAPPVRARSRPEQEAHRCEPRRHPREPLGASRRRMGRGRDGNPRRDRGSFAPSDAARRAGLAEPCAGRLESAPTVSRAGDRPPTRRSSRAPATRRDLLRRRVDPRLRLLADA